MNFKKYIKAVGTGVKGNKDLSFEEAFDAMENILLRKASDAQIGAFLVGFRVKLETNEELKGCIKALKKYSKTTFLENSLELGYSFDGRKNHPFLFPLYSDILEEFFKNNKDIEPLNLVINSDFLQPAKFGICVKDMINNIKIGKYLHIFDRKEYLKHLSDLTNLRHELGLRTAFNTIEKLSGVANSKYALTTAFHKPYVKKYIEIFSEYYDEVSVLKGSEGSPEVFKSGKYWKKIDNEIKEFEFNLEDYGIFYNNEFENISLNEALNIVKTPSNDIIKLAKFNIALYLFLSSRVESLKEAWDRLN